MAVLLTLASSAAPHVRHRFLQLSVVDFFVRELSLEFEATQPGGGRSALPEVSSTGSFFDQLNRPGSTGLLQSGARRNPDTSRDGLPIDQLPNASGLAKRGRSHSSGHLLQLPSDRSKDSGSPYNTPSPPIPKLRLPGSGNRSHEGSKGTSPAGAESPRRLAFTRGASSRRGSPPRGASRLGREAAAQAASAAAEASGGGGASGTGSGSRPLIPKLGLGALGLSSREADDDEDMESSLSPGPGPREVSDSSEDEDDQRISTVAAVHVPPLELLQQLTPSGTGGGRPLDGSISAAISLDKEWMPSARAGAAASRAAGFGGGSSSSPVVDMNVEVSQEGAWSPAKLPSGFVFSGDLDEDVERLEALERVSFGCFYCVYFLFYVGLVLFFFVFCSCVREDAS